MRHGETELNASGTWQGQLDVPLSKTGERQAARLAARLAALGERFSGVYSSDLARAMATAMPLARSLRLPVRPDPRLREICLGELAGKPRGVLLQGYAEVLEATREDPWGARFPGGESLADVRERLEAFLSGLPPGRHLVVTHAGPIRVAVWLALGLFAAEPWRLRIKNTSITRVAFPQGFPGPGEVYAVGDAAHLEAWAEIALETGR